MRISRTRGRVEIAHDADRLHGRSRSRGDNAYAPYNGALILPSSASACRSTTTKTFPSHRCSFPRALRRAVVAIYRFARTADDIADEGDASAGASGSRRSAASDARSTRSSAATRRPTPPFAELAAAIRAHALPVRLFRDLLSRVRAGRDDEALRDVRRRCSTIAAARPIRSGGCCCALRADDADEPARRATRSAPALQLINFWQDVAIDWRKGRVYLPQEDLARFGVDASADRRRRSCDRAGAR